MEIILVIWLWILKGFGKKLLKLSFSSPFNLFMKFLERVLFQNKLNVI
jgi:hypothetical protein